MTTKETTIAQLRKDFKTACFCKAQIVLMLAFANLGSVYVYKKWKKDKKLIPLRKYVGKTQARYDREHVFDVISGELTQ